MRQLAIYGLGLIGGSLAKALRAHSAAVRLVGIDLPEVLAGAASQGLVDELVDGSQNAAVRAALGASDLAVLAVPVRSIERLLPEALASCGAVTDCGSTKRSIVAVARNTPYAARFVGGHPMAGAPEGGLSRARDDLFTASTWILCPEGASQQVLAIVRDFVTSLGALPVEMSAELHDRAVALTSHVPQLIASALLALAGESGASAAAGPAFASATRVAGGPESMWRDIFETNPDEIAAALATLTARLESVGRALPDVGPALELLRAARASRGGGRQ
jgi:prephenate dehydrogenase